MNITTQSATYGSITKFSDDMFIATVHSGLVGSVTVTIHAEFSNEPRAISFLNEIGITAYNFRNATNL